MTDRHGSGLSGGGRRYTVGKVPPIGLASAARLPYLTGRAQPLARLTRRASRALRSPIPRAQPVAGRPARIPDAAPLAGGVGRLRRRNRGWRVHRPVVGVLPEA